MNDPDKPIVLVPPADPDLDRLARAVCTHLAAAGDEQYLDQPVMLGFADFLKFAAKLFAKQHNDSSGSSTIGA